MKDCHLPVSWGHRHTWRSFLQRPTNPNKGYSHPLPTPPPPPAQFPKKLPPTPVSGWHTNTWTQEMPGHRTAARQDSCSLRYLIRRMSLTVCEHVWAR